MISKLEIGWAMAIAIAPAVYAQQGLGFPIVGFGSGQVLRLNVLNLAAMAPPNPSSCGVELQFLDVSGKHLKQNSFQVTAGQTAFLELKQSEVSGASGRSEIRAILLFGQTGGAGPPTVRRTDCGSLVPSLEVYDQTTGKTTIFVTATSPLPAPFLQPQ